MLGVNRTLEISAAAAAGQSYPSRPVSAHTLREIVEKAVEARGHGRKRAGNFGRGVAWVLHVGFVRFLQHSRSIAQDPFLRALGVELKAEHMVVDREGLIAACRAREQV